MSRMVNGSAYHVLLAPCIPVIAGVRHDIRNLQVVQEVVWLLKHSPDETGGQVPRDVAVERPDAGVVLVPLQDDVRVGL